MKCRHCDKEFEAKRGTAKFCSTSCRVMYNRKNKKPKISEAVIENEIFGALEEMKELRKQIASDLLLFGQPRTDGKPLTGFKHDTPFSVSPVDEPLSFAKIEQSLTKPKIKRSFENYQELINECETMDQYRPIKEEIEAAEHLTSKQKTLLLRK